ncbi:MAG: RNase adapter RapZ [Clostridiaceae bacterium]
MRFVIVTGLSGAGKSQTINDLEDLGYFCVDNLPPKLILKFAEACIQSDGKIDKVALVVDIRGGEFFNDIFESLQELEDEGIRYEILFLDASNESLITRYKASRRAHPLSKEGRITKGIDLERDMLKGVKERADKVIDTTNLTNAKLKSIINKIYGERDEEKSMSITVVSFGFKYGIPIDSDLVFDVRFLPNPFYIPDLKKFSGNDAPVYDYVMGFKETKIFVEKLKDMLEFLIPYYTKEGKAQLIISIGCTGGRHRSVSIANTIFKMLKNDNYVVNIEHRDLNEDGKS